MKKKIKVNRQMHVDIKKIFDWALDEKFLNFESFKKKKSNQKYIKFFNEKNAIKNYEFSKKFTNKFFVKFYKQLNKYHNSDFSKNYWKVITYTWLFVTVNTIYEYWILFNTIKKKNISYKIYEIEDKLLEYEDTADLNRQSEHLHLWVLSQLIKYKKDVKYLETKYSKVKKNKIINFSLVKFLFKYISKFAIFFNSNKVFIKNLGLKSKHLLYLNFKLKQFPTIWFQPDFKKEEINIENRKNFFYTESLKKNFDGFFDTIIYKIIPKSYLENFKNINLALEKNWPKNANQILTQTIHSDDVFKIWISNMKLKKAKLNIFQHGGYYGMNLFHHGEYLESMLADKFFTWGWQSKDKKIFPFFSLFLNNRKLKKTSLGFDQRDNIILCVSSNTKYLSLPGFFPRNNLMRMEKIFLIQNSLKKLNNEIKKKIIIRYINKQYSRNGIVFNKRLFGKNFRFDDGSKNIINHLHETKLVIHDNRGSGWLETIFYDVPTVLIIDKNTEKFRKSFSKNLNNLKKSGIIHFTSSSLTNFLNKKHNKIERWWYSKQVQTSVKKLRHEYIKKSNDPFKCLIKKIKKLN